MTTTTNKPDLPEVAEKLYYRIGDVAEIAGVKPYVLRYWETEFPTISPEKSGTGQRIYRKADVDTVLLIKHLLYTERYSIEGAKKRIKELKRQGELKNYLKQDFSSAKAALDSAAVGQASSREVSREQTLQLARELKLLASRPVDTLFKF